jgi:hypothetical protein
MQENAVLHLRCSKLREDSEAAEGRVLELANQVRAREACLKLFDKSTAVSRLAEALLELKALRRKVKSPVRPKFVDDHRGSLSVLHWTLLIILHNNHAPRLLER